MLNKQISDIYMDINNKKAFNSCDNKKKDYKL